VFVLEGKELRDGWRKLHSHSGRSIVLVAVRLNLIVWDVTPYDTEESAIKMTVIIYHEFHNLHSSPCDIKVENKDGSNKRYIKYSVDGKDKKCIQSFIWET
jgi:hypothetical protein